MIPIYLTHAISPDPVGSTDLPVHKVLMAAEMVIIENLTGLGQLPPGQFVFSCFPLAFEDADGSPVRAVALKESPSP
jgi:arylformamidase